MIIAQENAEIDFSFKSRTDGTTELPLLINVTSGQRTTESIILHTKCEDKYHQMRIKRVNSNN